MGKPSYVSRDERASTGCKVEHGSPFRRRVLPIAEPWVQQRRETVVNKSRQRNTYDRTAAQWERFVFEQPLPTWIIDPATLRVTAANRAASTAFGRSRSRLRVRMVPFGDALQDLDRQDSLSWHTVCCRHRNVKGEDLFLQICWRAVRRGARRLLLFVATDLTSLKDFQEQSHDQDTSRYGDVFENAPDMVYTLDLKGRITSWNPAAQKLSGYQLRAGESVAVAGLFKEPSPKILERILCMLGGSSLGPEDRRMAGADGEEVVVEVREWLIFKNGVPIGVQGIGRDVSARRRADQEIFRLSGRLLEMQDDERRHVARELHDTTGQNLAALGFRLAWLIRTCAGDKTGMRTELFESLRLVEQCSEEIRTMSYLLHPPTLDVMGLASAVQWYADGFSRRSGIEVKIEIGAELGRFPVEIETTLFRVIQEALTNIYRHSGSQTAALCIECSRSMVVVQIRDRGKGIPAGSAHKAPAAENLGVGIAGMRERLRQLNGWLRIQSDTTGTTVTAAVPLVEGEQNERAENSGS
ncbi:MAG: PAS domain-containing sensor histidine kinase [Bryobacteraceae bacterium]